MEDINSEFELSEAYDKINTLKEQQDIRCLTDKEEGELEELEESVEYFNTFN